MHGFCYYSYGVVLSWSGKEMGVVFVCGHTNYIMGDALHFKIKNLPERWFLTRAFATAMYSVQL